MYELQPQAPGPEAPRHYSVNPEPWNRPNLER